MSCDSMTTSVYQDLLPEDVLRTIVHFLLGVAAFLVPP